ncbi:MAG: DUF3179 domain-containing protein [Acidimicrobiales bacterium]
MAAACSGSDDATDGSSDGETAADAESTATDSEDGESGGDGDGADSNDDAESDADVDEEASASQLFSPTETDEPFDLSTSVAPADDLVNIVADNPRDQLVELVGQATDPWTTDWTRQTVELDSLQLGIQRVDPRDAIPPIDVPKFEPIADARWIGEREPGALVQIGDDVRFYPLSILTRHEIVNDRFGDVPVVVSFCPLCNTAISFDARVDGQAVRFGVSGLLRNSDLVMWDEPTTTLWQQLTGEGIVGEYAGTQLELVPTSIVSYEDAKENFPEAWSLSRETGFPIEYGLNGYAGYSSGNLPFLFDGEPDPRYPALSRVVGITIDEDLKAYPFETIAEEMAVNDEVGGVPVAVLWGGNTADALDQAVIAEATAIGSGIAYDRRVGDQTLTFSSTGDDQFTDQETGSTWTLLGVAVDGPLAGEQLETVTHRNEFWFAWAAFFPEAAVYAG